MKTKIFLLLAIIVFFGCKKKEDVHPKNWIRISERIHYQEYGGFFELKSGKFTYKIPKSELPFKKVILLNASLVGYFTELNSEDKIVGISSPEYIYSERIQNLVKENRIQNIGNEQKYNVEKIISLKPDAIFTNYIASFENTYDLLKKDGIEVVFIDEYLEQNPLEKTKIIRLFGKLFGNEMKADSVYAAIEKKYHNLKNQASKTHEKPIVLANEMYGSQWFLPGGKTFTANFVKDAGADYIMKDNKDEKAVSMSFEEVFSKSQNAKFWVNVGNHQSKSELLAINPNYAKMEVYKKGNIYGITAKEKNKANDYFEGGVVRADLVLKDYVKIFHPELFPNYKLTYLNKLK